jgi:hypothetical protein
MISGMIRAAMDDVAEIHAMIRELTAHEQAVEPVRATGNQLREVLFCKSLGVELLNEWTVCRLSGEPLRELAARAPVALSPNPGT